jgi:hypothetical protein
VDLNTLNTKYTLLRDELVAKGDSSFPDLLRVFQQLASEYNEQENVEGFVIIMILYFQEKNLKINNNERDPRKLELSRFLKIFRILFSMVTQIALNIKNSDAVTKLKKLKYITCYPMDKLSEKSELLPFEGSWKPTGVFKKFLFARTETKKKRAKNLQLWTNWANCKKSAARPDNDVIVLKAYPDHALAMSKEDPCNIPDKDYELISELMKPELESCAKELAHSLTRLLSYTESEFRTPGSGASATSTRTSGGQVREIAGKYFDTTTRNADGMNLDRNNPSIRKNLSRIDQIMSIPLNEGEKFLKEIGLILNPDQPFDQKKWDEQLLKLRLMMGGEDYFERRDKLNTCKPKFQYNEELGRDIKTWKIKSYDSGDLKQVLLDELTPPELYSMRYDTRGNYVQELYCRYYIGNEVFLEHILQDCFGTYNNKFEYHSESIVHALIEPLKIRIITKGNSELNYLCKYFQENVWKALKERPQYKLIGSTLSSFDISRLIEGRERMDPLIKGTNLDKWCSIDYKASTDALSNTISRLILKDLKSEVMKEVRKPYNFHAWNRLTSPLLQDIENIDEIKGGLDISILEDRIDTFFKRVDSSSFGQTIVYSSIPSKACVDYYWDESIGDFSPELEHQYSIVQTGHLLHTRDILLKEGFIDRGTPEHHYELLHDGSKEFIYTWNEKSPHTIEISQINGQLMGSLPSFPILCLVNHSLYKYSCYKYIERTHEALGGKAILKLALEQGSNVLVNGDDMLYLGNQELYDIHKDLGKHFGLEFSIGKSYVSDFFGQINSQNFYVSSQTGAKEPIVHLLSPFQVGLFCGKQKILDRVAPSSPDEDQEELVRNFPLSMCFTNVIDSCHPLQEKMVAALYLERHNKALKKELGPRNLFIPINKGGMGQRIPLGWEGLKATYFQQRFASFCFTETTQQYQQLGLKMVENIQPLPGILPLPMWNKLGRSPDFKSGPFNLLGTIGKDEGVVELQVGLPEKEGEAGMLEVVVDEQNNPVWEIEPGPIKGIRPIPKFLLKKDRNSQCLQEHYPLMPHKYLFRDFIGIKHLAIYPILKEERVACEFCLNWTCDGNCLTQPQNRFERLFEEAEAPSSRLERLELIRDRILDQLLLLEVERELRTPSLSSSGLETRTSPSNVDSPLQVEQDMQGSQYVQETKKSETKQQQPQIRGEEYQSEDQYDPIRIKGSERKVLPSTNGEKEANP